MSINLGSDLSTVASAYNTSSSTNKLESNLGSDLKNSSDDELMDVCKSFESYFVEQVFKEMKKTVPQSEDEQNNEYMNYFGDMLNEEYAKNVTESGSMGIAQLLYESMKRN